MQKIIACILLIFSALGVNAQTEKDMRWISLPEAEQASKTYAKPLLIDLYTDWCGWCKVMDKKTYSNKYVKQYLAEKFYTVKLDAEQKESLKWSGQQYDFNPQYKTNDIAIFLTGGQLSYPTTIIIPAPGEQPQVIPGYMSPTDFEMVLKYYGEGYYKTKSVPEYQKMFKGSWR